MGTAERSRERVEAHLDSLERVYDGVSVNQTTLSLQPEQYSSMRERAAKGHVEAVIEVHDEESKVLHLRRGGEADLPSVRVTPEEDPESRVRETVREQAGIACVVDGLERATIAGIRNAEDPDAETVYLLSLTFRGRHTGGVVAEDAEWRPGTNRVESIEA